MIIFQKSELTLDNTLTLALLTEKEQEYCKTLLKKCDEEERANSKMSTRPSTRQQFAREMEKKSSDFPEKFSILEKDAEEKLNEIKAKIEKENTEMMQVVEEIRKEILDIKEDIDIQRKENESESSSLVFLTKLSKKLEVKIYKTVKKQAAYLKKKDPTPIVATKKPKNVRLKAVTIAHEGIILKHPSTASADKNKNITSKINNIKGTSKVSKLRSTIQNFREEEDEK